jgi:hypothetical protein
MESWTQIQRIRLAPGQAYGASGPDGEHIHARQPYGGASWPGCINCQWMAGEESTKEVRAYSLKDRSQPEKRHLWGVAPVLSTPGGSIRYDRSYSWEI